MPFPGRGPGKRDARRDEAREGSNVRGRSSSEGYEDFHRYSGSAEVHLVPGLLCLGTSGDARYRDSAPGSADVHLVPGLLGRPVMSTIDLSDAIDLPWRCEAALVSQASFGVLDVRRAAHRCSGASSSKSSRVDQKSARSGVPALHHRVDFSTAKTRFPPTP